MLSNREKEIIYLCYSIFAHKIYARSGPSWLNQNDLDDLKSYISFLKQPDVKPRREDNDIKDCTTCKYGCFNDIFQQYFCYNNDIECKEWNKWEARI